MPPLHIVILAAGQGKRMYSDLPKVLHPLAGKPLLQHVIDTAYTLQPDKLVVVYGHGKDQVSAAITDPKIEWVYQAAQRGTGDALKCAMSAIEGGITAVLYGDVPLISAQTLTSLLKAAGQNKVALLTDIVADPAGYGRILRDAQGKVAAIIEDKDADAAVRSIQEINTGIAAFPTASLATWLGRLNDNNTQQEYYLTDVFAMAAAEGMDICTVHPAAPWEAEGVNNKQQLAKLERIYQQQYAERLLKAGVTLLDPARIDIRGELICDKDVLIDVNVVCEGTVKLGRGVHVGANCVLKNVDIKAGCHIAPFSHLNGAQIGENSRIGPFARLRPGTQLADAVHIGNFVEVKKSVVDSGAKINHLTYIGDAYVGAKTNIGAGTITCNYDGVNKFTTHIGANVFIGSGTMLIAPLNVGDGATIGAGSTITRSAPAEKLTLERGKQLTIEGWRRPSKK
jgi:bifunctional UDP-N-acetylglucosamine pyrophosphorylase/glucosamine-1-phosphate N-acetyltransferase